MMRPKLPALDAADRRIVGVAVVLVFGFLLACMVIGAGLGAGVAMFRLLAWWW